MSEILSIGELLDLGNSAATAGLVPYSALEYDGTGRISGISGSAIAGGVDSAVVSSIVSSYVSSKVDKSAFDNCCSSVQSALSGKLDASASGQFAPSGDYVYESSYSSFSGDVVNNISSMSSIVSGLTGEYIEASASSMFQPSGSYVSASDMSAYVPFSGFEYSAGTQTITAISGSAIGGSEFNGVYTDFSLSGNGLLATPLSVMRMDLDFDTATLERSLSGNTATISVNPAYTIPVKAVSNSADATASNILYIVTGSEP